jgi:hypothetical protein
LETYQKAASLKSSLLLALYESAISKLPSSI